MGADAATTLAPNTCAHRVPSQITEQNLCPSVHRVLGGMRTAASILAMVTLAPRFYMTLTLRMDSMTLTLTLSALTVTGVVLALTLSLAQLTLAQLAPRLIGKGSGTVGKGFGTVGKAFGTVGNDFDFGTVGNDFRPYSWQGL